MKCLKLAFPTITYVSSSKPTFSTIYTPFPVAASPQQLSSLICSVTMAKSLCCLLLCFLILFNYCSARQQKSRQQNECSISRLTAQKPSNRIQSEAGVTEVFDHNNEQFQCAGVAVVRYTIEPNGLLLPSYVNAPQLLYFVQGKALN